MLNVPTLKVKGEKTQTFNTQISYVEDWQKLHLKSLESAYRSSPFFEFYQDDLAKIFTTKFKTIGELHQACHDFVMDALQEDFTLNTTKEYQKTYSNKIDFRHLINTKKPAPFKFAKYVQVFDDKHGFIPNLSILDLLFMEGPNASMYLEKIELSHAEL